MFKSPRDYIIVALVLIIALLIIFRRDQPQDQTEGREFKEEIARLNSQKAIKDAQIEAIFQESEHKDSTTKVELRAKDKEISLLKAKLSKQRPPITIMADSVPELKAFIATQDSLLTATEQRADTLQMAYTSQIETTRDLKRLIVDKDKITDNMILVCSERVDKLQRDYEKEHKRKGVFKKIAGVLGIIALTETAILALQ